MKGRRNSYLSQVMGLWSLFAGDGKLSYLALVVVIAAALLSLLYILGMAIERQRIEQNLQNAVERQQVLMREVNYRVNNSLQMVASVLHLRSSVAASQDVRKEFLQAETRISAIALAHRRLYSGDQITAIDLAAYLREACNDIAASVSDCDIKVAVEEGNVIRTDRAVPAVLSVNELITNAGKYAYRDGSVNDASHKLLCTDSR